MKASALLRKTTFVRPNCSRSFSVKSSQIMRILQWRSESNQWRAFTGYNRWSPVHPVTSSEHWPLKSNFRNRKQSSAKMDGKIFASEKNDEWKGANWLNRHFITRFAVHRFQRQRRGFCRLSDFYEPDSIREFSKCGKDCDRYHATCCSLTSSEGHLVNLSINLAKFVEPISR